MNSPDDKCLSCDHPREWHGDHSSCSSCGCFGFFPPGAKFCENPNCQGSGCTSNRPRPIQEESDHE